MHQVFFQYYKKFEIQFAFLLYNENTNFLNLSGIENESNDDKYNFLVNDIYVVIVSTKPHFLSHSVHFMRVEANARTEQTKKSLWEGLFNVVCENSLRKGVLLRSIRLW